VKSGDVTSLTLFNLDKRDRLISAIIVKCIISLLSKCITASFVGTERWVSTPFVMKLSPLPTDSFYKTIMFYI
jgi:hypothetical protein